MHRATKTLALSFAAAAGLSGLNALTPHSAEAATRCDSGTLLGRYTLKSEVNNKFVRAGIGSDSYVGAKSNNVGGNTSWETFDIYDLGNRDGLNGGTYALRSTQDPNRWVSVNSQNALKLMHGCTTRSRNRLFRANRISNILQLQSLYNQQWVIQRSDNMLYANAATTGGNVPKALQYRLIRIGSGPTPPAPQQQVNLNGWFRGNNKGIYSAQRSGNAFQMKGFINGRSFNLITGSIQGNTIHATWKNYCNSNTGSIKLRITSNGLIKIGGSPSFNTSWTPTQVPGSLSNTPDCQAASNITGTWRSNDGGTYVIRQSGTIVTWTGQGGNFQNVFSGQRQGNIVTGYWQDTAGSQTQNSGQLVFKIVNGSKLQKVSSTGAFSGTVWTR